jgi:hypothetical protein
MNVADYLEIFCYQYNFCGTRATEYLLLNFCGTHAAKLFPFSMLEQIVEKVVILLLWKNESGLEHL